MTRLQGFAALVGSLVALVVAVGGLIRLLPQAKSNADSTQALAAVSFDRMLSDSITAYRLARIEAQLALLSVTQPTPAQVDRKMVDATIREPMRDTTALRQVRAIARPLRQEKPRR